MTVQPYQVAAVVLGLLMLLFTSHEFYKRKIGPVPFAFWTLLWLGILMTGLFPDLYVPITRQVGLQTPIQFVTSFSVLALFILVFQIYARLGTIEKNLAKLGQVVAVERYLASSKRPSPINPDKYADAEKSRKSPSERGR